MQGPLNKVANVNRGMRSLGTMKRERSLNGSGLSRCDALRLCSTVEKMLQNWGMAVFSQHFQTASHLID
jgi:hypothetical protein